ncbi:hypothetical protein LOK49_LG13G01877 [Camellia lanceoleosa]|uniref:Uncharacterized protein n=1 Tax=Camellia lanceoleosa TaxID=1840588 RepID=A0ACC0FNP7_9ERIC|nr:hypothetical protein LOK49_LG13G01877 [Camellia lanceoleosa]
MVINVGPEGRFWRSKGKPGALSRKSQQCFDQVYTTGCMRSLSESSMLKPGLNLEVVLGSKLGSTDQVLHKEAGPSVNVVKDGNNNRKCKGKAVARVEHGKQQGDTINLGEKVQLKATIEESNGRGKGKKVAVAFGRSTGDQLVEENRARVQECGQAPGSKIKGHSQRTMRKLRSSQQFFQGFHRGAIFRAAAALWYWYGLVLCLKVLADAFAVSCSVLRKRNGSNVESGVVGVVDLFWLFNVVVCCAATGCLSVTVGLSGCWLGSKSGMINLSPTAAGVKLMWSEAATFGPSGAPLACLLLSQLYADGYAVCSRLVSRPSSLLQWRPRSLAFPRRRSAVVRPRACEKLEEKNVLETEIEWGKVSAVLYDMDGVLCNSEEPSRVVAVDVFAEMGVEVSVEDFVPFMGTGFPGAFELINQCKSKGLKVAVASSADRIKILNVPTSECIVIEDALAGVQAAKAAQRRCIAVTTTLSEETLKTASPSLIRQEIGSVSFDDILSGGSGCQNEKMQGPSLLILLHKLHRHCSKTEQRAMQYTSPKALWNSLFGVGTPSFQQNEGVSRSARVHQFVNYISDLETRGTARIVPEFPSKLDWLNTVPLKLSRDLKGKVVLLNFWTYCCINYLEAIRNAVLRYGITHLVVNDGDMYLWHELGINSWPTFAIVGPNGKLLAQISGEGRRKD